MHACLCKCSCGLKSDLRPHEGSDVKGSILLWQQAFVCDNALNQLCWRHIKAGIPHLPHNILFNILCGIFNWFSSEYSHDTMKFGVWLIAVSEGHIDLAMMCRQICCSIRCSLFLSATKYFSHKIEKIEVSL